jgi:hypothetical protein
MATPADQRILDLLDQWLGSLELHLKYTALDDDSYWKVRSWVPHQRPTRWIIELATQKTRALRDQVQERVDRGDTGFSDGLEQMAFLANLVGIQHIERFIPLAEPAAAPSAPDRGAPAAAEGLTGTMEMPKFPQSMLREPPAVANRAVARTERKRAHKPHTRSKASAKPAAPASPLAHTPAHPPEPPPPPPPVPAAAPAPIEAQQDSARAQVIADAARLMHWGRNWYELAELIARMADRPPLPEVRRILQENKAAIDEKAGRT